jgi:hypothetical protein
MPRYRIKVTDWVLLNRWREAGKQVGRKVGVVSERYRIIDLIQSEIELSLQRGAILQANYLLEIKEKIKEGKK